MTTTYDQVRPKDNYGQRGPIVYAPPTTDSALVFNYDKSKKKFDRNFYTPFLTEGRASSEQMESFLSSIERKIHKKMNKINKINKFFTIWAIASFVILFLFGFMIFSDDEYSEVLYDDSYGDYDGVDAFFMVFMLYLFALCFYSLLLQCVTRRKEKKTRQAIERHVEKHAGEFTAQGLKWVVPLAFPHWIELWKDYRVQNTYPQALAAPQQNTFNNLNNNNQIPANYQYLPMPQQNIPRNPLNVQPQPRQMYPSLMAQPLLSHQGPESQNYIPPINNYEN